MDQEPQSSLVKVRGASKVTGFSESQLNKLRVYGGGPEYIKIGKSVFYELSALHAWIAAHRRSSTSQSAAA
jgi:predicted DNA-binding transcriptional regulator AlpA